MDLAIGRDWDGTAWIDSTSGGGAVSVTDSILTTTAAAAGVAVRRIQFPATPGMRIEVEVQARYVSGAATGTGVFIELIDYDGTDLATNAARVDLKDNDWKRYHIAYTVPLDQSVTERFVRITFGVKDTLGGDARFQLPSIRFSRSYGVPLVVARGVVRLASGVVSVLTWHPSMGIASVAFNGTTTVTVTLNHSIHSTVLTDPQIQITNCGAGALTAIRQSITRGATPSFNVRWTNGTAIQNVAAQANLEFDFVVFW